MCGGPDTPVYVPTSEPEVQITHPTVSGVGTGTSSGGVTCGFTNVDGNWVECPGDDPAGATARCNDGTYS